MGINIKQRNSDWRIEIQELFEFDSQKEFMEFIDFLTKLKLSNGLPENNESSATKMLGKLYKKSKKENIPDFVDTLKYRPYEAKWINPQKTTMLHGIEGSGKSKPSNIVKKLLAGMYKKED